MASPIHGRKGRLYVAITSGGTAEPLANLNNWTFDSNTDKVDTTVFGDTNKTSAAGLPNAAGTFAGFYDSGTAQTYTASTDGVARKFYLYPTTDIAGTYWFGTALFDFTAGGAVDGAVTVSGSWTAASSVQKVG